MSKNVNKAVTARENAKRPKKSIVVKPTPAPKATG